MNVYRVLPLLCVWAGATSSEAQWLWTELHPAGANYSWVAGAGSSTNQAGYVQETFFFHAAAWSGTSGSWVDLHPEGASRSFAYDASILHQVGYAKLGLHDRPILWSGSAVGYVDLTPPAWQAGRALGATDPYQVGYVHVAGFEHAALWSGTPTSWVDLHPSGATESHAEAVCGNFQGGFAVYNVYVPKAVMWSGSAASAVLLHPANATESQVLAVSENAQGGFATIGNMTRACLWRGTADSLIDLNPAGAASSRVGDMAGVYQVGTASIGGSQHAGFWTGTSNSWEDLQGTLPAWYVNSVANSIAIENGYLCIVGNADNTLISKTVGIVWRLPIADTFLLKLNKTIVAGQNSVLGSISLAGPNPQSVTYATYDDSSLVQTPPSVTIQAGQTSKSFQITVSAITSTLVTTIYAKRGSFLRSQTLTLTPLIPTALVFAPGQAL